MLSIELFRDDFDLGVSGRPRGNGSISFMRRESRDGVHESLLKSLMVDGSRVKKAVTSSTKRKKTNGKSGSFTGSIRGYRSVQVVSPVP